ncbi:hypothetical protein PQX77_006120 [Marasmius sp. AFHP31]|nr:hypothetical protein PQX77_006120 [Marasmius sp. AFHP31]
MPSVRTSSKTTPASSPTTPSVENNTNTPPITTTVSTNNTAASPNPAKPAPIFASLECVSFDDLLKEWLFQPDDQDRMPISASLDDVKGMCYTSYAIAGGMKHVEVTDMYLEAATLLNSKLPVNSKVRFATYDDDGEAIRGERPVGLKDFYTADALAELGLLHHDGKLKMFTRHRFPKPETTTSPISSNSVSGVLQGSSVAPAFGMGVLGDILATERGQRTVIHSLVNAAAGQANFMQKMAVRQRQKEEKRIAEAYELNKKREMMARVKAAKNIIASASKDKMDTTSG